MDSGDGYPRPLCSNAPTIGWIFYDRGCLESEGCLCVLDYCNCDEGSGMGAHALMVMALIACTIRREAKEYR